MRLSIVVVCAVLLAVPAAASADDAKPIYALVAEDAQFVAVVDLADARGAASFATIMKETGAEAKMTEATNKLGIDLAKDVDVIRLGGTQDDLVLLVDGHFTAKHKKTIASGTAKKHRGVAYWIHDDSAVFWAGKRLVFARADRVTAAIDRWKKKAPSMGKGAGAADLRAAIAMTDTRNDLWIAVTTDLLVAQGMPDTGLEAVSLAATAATDVGVEVRARAGAADVAAEMEKTIGAFLPQLQDAMKGFGLAQTAQSVRVDRDDLVLSVAATIPVAELTALIGMLNR
jgi:hypothetical protein